MIKSLYWPAIALMVFTGLSSEAKADFDINSFLTSARKKALILLDVRGVVSGTGKAASNHGSAFFISDSGFALTAAHVLFDQSKIADANRILPNGTDLNLQGHIGSSGSPPYEFQIVKVDNQMDIALISLVDPIVDPDSPRSFLTICKKLPSLNDNLFALGFPGGLPLASPSGRRLGTLVGNKYPVQIDINSGMSGGPVLDADGMVFGVSVSGIRSDGFQGYNFVLPLSFANDMLESADVKENCGTPLPKIPPEIASALTVTIHVTDQGQLEEANKIGLALRKYGIVTLPATVSGGSQHNLIRFYNEGDAVGARALSNLIGEVTNEAPTLLKLGSMRGEKGLIDYWL